MEHYLKLNILDYSPKIDISKEEYENLKKSNIVLSNGMSIEEIYEILISNYIDLENDLSFITIENMVRRNFDNDYFFNSRVIFNKRLVNLLTSARLYVDQIGRHVKNILSKEGSKEDIVKSLFNDEYEASHEYRFMEALRNYVQHRGIPVHLTSYKMAKEGDGKDRGLVYSTEIFFDKSKLQDKKFKKRVLDEMPDKVNLMQTTRKYIECLSIIQRNIRDLTSRRLNEAKGLIESSIERYKEVHSGSVVGLEAYRSDGNNLFETVPLNLEWEETRSMLVRRNPQLPFLSKRHVSTKIESS